MDADPQGDLTTSLGWPEQDNLSVTLATQLEGIVADREMDRIATPGSYTMRKVLT